MPIELIVQSDVAAATRDGTILRADVYRPARGGPNPVLLMRTQFQEERQHDTATTWRRQLAEGIAYFARIPFLRATIAMIAVSFPRRRADPRRVKIGDDRGVVCRTLCSLWCL